MFRRLFDYRDLLALLVVREFRIRYARALLGAAWAVFVPLVMALLFSLIGFGRLLATGGPFAGIPYPVFAYLGLVFWMYTANSLTQATPSLVNSADMLHKAAFPREVIPLAKTLANLIDLGVGLLCLLVIMWLHRAGLRVSWPVACVPVILLLQVAFTAGLALLLSAANLFYRDVNYLVQVLLVLGMFATSVVYPLPSPESHPVAGAILGLNPMAAYLDAYREAVALGQWPFERLALGAAWAAVSLAGGATVFRRVSRRFAEEV